MKRHLHAALFAIATLLALPAGASAAGGSVPAGDAAMPVAAAAAIDARRASLRASERPVDGFSLEGTRVTTLRGPRAIEKIEVEALGERGRARFDFYWQGGALVAARERRVGYGDTITALPTDRPLPQNPLLDETVGYAAGRAAQHWRDGQALDVRSADSRERARELAAQAEGFRRLAQTPAPAGSEGCRWSCSAERGSACRAWVCR